MIGQVNEREILQEEQSKKIKHIKLTEQNNNGKLSINDDPELRRLEVSKHVVEKD